MKNYVKVFAPATVSNVGCGFDIFGFAIDFPGDEVKISINKDHNEVKITKISGDNGKLPKEPYLNTAGVCVLSYLKKLNLKLGLDIEITKKMPLGSGLGSSAASAVASIFALNYLLDNKLSTEELLPFILESEKVACGSAHADNAAPSLLGGFILIKSYEPLEIIKIQTPNDLFCGVIHPDIEIKTKDARDILPKNITLKNCINQSANCASLIYGLLTNNYDIISKSLIDYIAEPYRYKLIPYYEEIKNIALKSGVLGCNISGSGPSIFILSNNENIIDNSLKNMSNFYNGKNISNQIYKSKINKLGPKIIEEG